ncbi:MAG: hypothetical protein KGK08_01235 [Acidobacteriota bacterium]|nr:hypothetical protein [Acidobacteriota bacterium]
MKQAETARAAVRGQQAMARGHQAWLMVGLAGLVLASVVFTACIIATFLYFAENSAPFWITVVGVLSLVTMAVSILVIVIVFALIAVRARRAGNEAGRA